MAALAIPNKKQRDQYENLLNALNDSMFRFTIPLDKNRQVDGMELRYRFGNENDISNEEIKRSLDNRECSMLEMMVALALRGDEQIMYDADLGSRISTWFAEMLKSLKLDEMENRYFDQRLFDYRIDCLLNHEYEPRPGLHCKSHNFDPGGARELVWTSGFNDARFRRLAFWNRPDDR